LSKERYSENVQGDFYVENQVCITCGAPEAEAPDLIEHSKLEYGHCYFKKQPITADELDRAISAMQVSCIAGVRYGGSNKAILKRLFDLGLQSECDYSMTDTNMTQDFNFFKTVIPASREADFYLGCLGGSVFMDFNQTSDNLISLCRISFDGYGCCNLTENSKSLNFEKSKEFKQELSKDTIDQEKITLLVKELLFINQDNIWPDALEKYNLLE